MLSTGRWSPGYSELAPAVGVLVIEGVAIVQLCVHGQSTADIVAAGDLVRPWERDIDLGMAVTQVHWEVLTPLRIAVLDEDFVAKAARWPGVLERIFSSTIARSHRVMLSAAHAQRGRAEDRVLLALTDLAVRVGRVTREGVVIPLRLRHRHLASLSNCTRPTVTTAINRLVEQNVLVRRNDELSLVQSADALQGMFNEGPRHRTVQGANRSAERAELHEPRPAAAAPVKPSGQRRNRLDRP